MRMRDNCPYHSLHPANLQCICGTFAELPALFLEAPTQASPKAMEEGEKVPELTL